MKRLGETDRRDTLRPWWASALFQPGLGQFRGKRIIRGGRTACVLRLVHGDRGRPCVFNPVIRTFAHILEAKSKPGKVSIVAWCKLLCLLNAR